MRELVYLVATSLDGRIAGPDDDVSAFPVEGDHIEMLVRDLPETRPAPARAAFSLTAPPARFDTVLMGWNTYAYGVSQGLDDPYPHLRQYVVSRRAPRLPDGITVCADPVPLVRRLKSEPAEGPDGPAIWLCGGGQLASALREEIDRLVLKINPVVLGEGVGLFAHGDAALALRAGRVTPYRSGVVVAEYERADRDRRRSE